jgi:type I restriction enzyme M protein
VRNGEFGVLNQENLATFIWSVADLMRGTLRRSQYGRAILPFTVLRRLECVLEPTRDKVLAKAAQAEGKPEGTRHRMLKRAAGREFYNTAEFRLGSLSETHTRDDLMAYVQRSTGHSWNAAGAEYFS